MKLYRKPITSKQIMELCGTTSYNRGQSYYETDQVHKLEYNASTLQYEAIVSGSKQYKVSVSIDPYGEVEAACQCPAFESYYSYCKHIAAVLLEIADLERKLMSTPTPSDERIELAHTPSSNAKAQQTQLYLQQRAALEELRKTEQFLSIFENAPATTKKWLNLSPGTGKQDLLQVEFICHAVTAYNRPSIFTIEMKVGPKKPYVVQKIKAFLKHVIEKKPLEFTKVFTYDPAVHVFRKEDEEVVQALIEIYRNESTYRESWGSPSTYTSFNNDRELMIAPMEWEKLLPKLLDVQVQIHQNQDVYDQLTLSDEKLPLTFEFNEAPEQRYQLDIHGFDELMLLENYGYAMMDGRLYKLSEAEEKQIIDMKRMLQHAPQLTISRELMEPFMKRVLPSLRNIGTVEIAQQINERIMQHPLKAKLYLDRNEQESLLVRVEFVYGDIVIQPNRRDNSSVPEAEVILIRDTEKESHITALIESISSIPGSRGYLFEHEEDIYDFLYHVLIELEKLCEVYATSAVREVMHTPSRSGPKATVDVNAAKTWLQIGFNMEGLDTKEIQSLVRSIMEKKKYYRMPSGAFVSLEQDEFQQFGQLLEQLGVKKSDVKGPQVAVPVLRGLRLEDQEGRFKSIKFGKAFRQLMEHLKHPDSLEFDVPEELSPILRDYQKYGFQWMKTLAHYQFGGILADDMGLGKTLQSITFILSEQQKALAERKPTLIVCPASLVYNWERECRKFAPNLQVSVAAGDKKERAEKIEALRNTDVSGVVDVLITSYPLLRRDIELYEQHIFGALFLDEAQAIKNHASQTAQMVKQLQAERRFALTGTPIENSLEELWSIFDAVFPDLFTSKKVFNDLPHEQVAKMVRPFILRRMKRDVLTELPDKIETNQTSELAPEQKKLYAAYLEKIRTEAKQDMDDQGFNRSKMKILAGLTRLRQLCCHPALFIDDYNGPSSKMEQLFEIIEECLSGGKRMLIFSQFTGMLDIIRSMLSKMDLPCFYLGGNTPSQDRLDMCTRFNEGENDIFLISLKAGGTGLNLTGADTVILYDLWWNPAVEQQAADRAHRMGQKNVVQVIRLITQGTVEEKMYELQQKKKDLIDQVIQTGEGAVSSLSEAEIRELLMI